MINENNNNNNIIIIISMFCLAREMFSFILRFIEMNFSWGWGCQSLSPSPAKTSSLF